MSDHSRHLGDDEHRAPSAASDYNPQPGQPDTWVEGITVLEHYRGGGFRLFVSSDDAEWRKFIDLRDLAVDAEGNLLRDGDWISTTVKVPTGYRTRKFQIGAYALLDGPCGTAPIARWSLERRKKVAAEFCKIEPPSAEPPSLDPPEGEDPDYFVVYNRPDRSEGVTASDPAWSPEKRRAVAESLRKTAKRAKTKMGDRPFTHCGEACDIFGIYLRAKKAGVAPLIIIRETLDDRIAACQARRREEIAEAGRQRRKRRGSQRDGLMGGCWPGWVG